MRNFIQSPRWAIRLALVRLGERLETFSARRTRASTAAIERVANGPFGRFVDRVDPWIVGVGYRRRVLRRTLYSLRLPQLIVRDVSWEIANRLHRPVLGRFEGHGAENALKAQWLVDEAEPTTSFGNWTEWISVSAWLDYDVPWSTEPEHWIGILDGHGFWTLEQHVDKATALARLDDLEREWDGFTAIEYAEVD